MSIYEEIDLHLLEGADKLMAQEEKIGSKKSDIEENSVEEGDDTVSAVAINPVYKVGKPIKEMPVMSKKQINECKAAVEKYLHKGK